MTTIVWKWKITMRARSGRVTAESVEAVRSKVETLEQKQSREKDIK
jgi:hypothetical protein